MSYTRKIRWEIEREYDTIEEAKDDEDCFMKDSSPNACQNYQLYSNELTDESGITYEDEE